jgi:DNA invertase Pin-like site-specific DNA recombinase
MLIGYMRVSTDTDRQSTDLQRDALVAAGVDARHLFEDRASGAQDNRPDLAKALDFMQPGDVLVVWKLDRLGRSLSHLLAIVNTLRERQVAFRSLTEALDTTTPAGEFLFQVFGALAQYERYADIGIALVMPSARLCRSEGETWGRMGFIGRHNRSPLARHRPSRKASMLSEGL